MKTDYGQLSGILLSALACYAAYALLFNRKGNNMTNPIPRGYRNNNPLNIRINPANAWAGRRQPNTDGEFEQFVSMEYGYRAAFVLIRNYIGTYGLRTVSDIIRRWAPPSENLTDRYVAFVCRKTGFTPQTVISPDNGSQMCALVYAMAWMENGATPNEAQLRRGWEMA